MHTASPPDQQPDQPEALADAWLAGDDKLRGGFLIVHLLQPGPEHRVGLANQNAISQLWFAKKKCR